jgi:hypothetical protein
MKRFSESRLLRLVALLGVLAVSGLASAGNRYLVTNDDSAFPFPMGVSFYAVGANGVPVFQQQVFTGLFGIQGGYFGVNRIAVLDSSSQQCVYASEAGNGDIVGIAVSSLSVGGKASGSTTDSGAANGIGLTMNSTYLYASFTSSNTIGTFMVQPGCGLAFLSDTPVAGVNGGAIDGMAIHGTMLIATYTDGSIESFDISGGPPVSNGDEQLSTATARSQDSTYANSVDITSNGHYAIFGDTSTSLSVEVSDISSGKLTATKVYSSPIAISSSNIILSPDETLLYVVNTQGDAVSALFFDKTSGKLSRGCTSGRIRGQSQLWSYLAGVSLLKETGSGGGVYVAEFSGSSSGIAMVTISLSGQTCSLQEASMSPVTDSRSPGLLSIGTFPPRSF